MILALLLAFLLPASPSEAAPIRCSGAAAMVERGCLAHRHLKTVSPYPSDQLDAKWGVGEKRNQRFCRGGLQNYKGLGLCFLGSVSPRKTIALIGDSHSAHWRPAMDRMGRREGVRIISLVGSGCDFSVLGRFPVPDFDMSACDRFRARVPAFLSSRPDIEAAVMAQASYQGPGEKQGYLEAWKSLPSSIKSVVTIVDNPRGSTDLYGCMRRAVSRGARPGVACAQPRSEVLKPDYAASAALEIEGRRGQVLDFSDLFCDRRRCFPAIGGRLVYAQGSHQAPGFNLTLAPYLANALREAGVL